MELLCLQMRGLPLGKLDVACGGQPLSSEKWTVFGTSRWGLLRSHRLPRRAVSLGLRGSSAAVDTAGSHSRGRLDRNISKRGHGMAVRTSE